jgi:hypothetical protein
LRYWFLPVIQRELRSHDFGKPFQAGLHHPTSRTFGRRRGLAVNGGYYRTWYGNFTVTDNLSVTPANYDPYCITVPVDPRLPGGGGNQICGLYDINPSQFGQVNNLVTFASNFGKQTEIYNGVDFNVNARFKQGIVLSGGVSVGDEISTSQGLGVSQSATSDCFVVNSPQQLYQCNVHPTYRANFKVFGVYPLPWWDLQASANFQSLPGAPIAASYSVPTAQIAPSLGRNLAGGTKTATIQLITPYTEYDPRITQLDLRLTKSVRVRSVRIKGMFDLYNALNASPILALNTTYGSAWLQPLSILNARLAKFGVQFEF